jgi:hypothetical protein
MDAMESVERKRAPLMMETTMPKEVKKKSRQLYRDYVLIR